MTDLESRLRTILNEKETKIKPENIKKGVTILGVDGKLDGTTSDGEIKLFETVEEMKASTGNEEGDLAIIYRSEIQPLTADSVVSGISFESTVVLNEAITTSGYAYLVDKGHTRSSYYQLRYSSTYFYIRDYMTYEYIVRYSSTDGITYTLSGDYSTTHIPVEPLCFDGTWNDIYGKFILCGGMMFEGLFEYTLNHQTEEFQLPNLATATINYSSDGTQDDSYVYNELLPTKYSISKLNSLPFLTQYAVVYENINGELKLVCSEGTSPFNRIIVDGNNNVIGLASLSTTVTTVKRYTVDLDTSQLTSEESLTSIVYGSNYSYILLDDIKSGPIQLPKTSNTITVYDGMIQLNQTMWNWSNKLPLNVYVDTYLPAATQLTVNSSNELLPGKIAYGKNGVIVGDESVYENLDSTYVLNNMFGMQSLIECTPNNITGLIKNKLYGFRPDTNGEYGEMYFGFANECEQPEDTSGMTYGYQALSYVHDNKLYLIGIQASGSKNFFCKIYDISDKSVKYLGVNTFSVTTTTAATLSDFDIIPYGDGSTLYIPITNGYGDYGCAIDMYTYNIIDNSITKLNGRKLTSGKAYNHTVDDVDVARTCIYGSYHVDEVYTYYKYNWSTNTVTNLNNGVAVITPINKHNFHSKYMIGFKTPDDRHTTAHVYDKDTDTIKLTINLTTSSTACCPHTYYVDDFAYVFTYNCMYKVDLNTMTYTTYPMDGLSPSTSSGSSYNAATLLGDNLLWISTYDTTDTLYIFNLTDITITRCTRQKYSTNKYNMNYCTAVIIENDDIRLISPTASASNYNTFTLDGMMVDTYLIKGSLDDFGKGLIGVVYDGDKCKRSSETPNLDVLLK